MTKTEQDEQRIANAMLYAAERANRSGSAMRVFRAYNQVNVRPADDNFAGTTLAVVEPAPKIVEVKP